MNDEQSAASSEQTGAQELGENIGVAQAQAQLTELVASARSAYENARASKDDAKNVLGQLKQLLTEAREASDKISEATPKFAAAATEVELKRSAIATSATEVETKRSTVATHAQQVDDAQKRAAEVRGMLDKLLISANQTQAEADGLKQSVESAKSSASQADADIAAIKATVDENAKAVAAALVASNTSSAKTKGLASIAETVEKRVNDYEAKLVELSAQCDAQLDAIKSLLPGATSAGLASAFDKRRQTFLQPGIRWQRWFIGSIVTLAVITLASLIEAWFHISTMTYQQLLVQWLSRLPFAAALVWLAMHASRESALAKRLEEDYGFKASVASSFQGFQEQMKIVGGSVAGNEPLKALCDATLAQITNPPGRIYEKHALIVSPATELLKAAQMIVDAAKAGKLPVG
jgi:ABC-type transporter Mla subunit MlaD